MPNIDLGKVVGEQGPEGPAAQGTMTEATYDPNGKSQDVFAYADAAKQEAKDYAAPKTHASQHGASGSDPVTPAEIGAVAKTGDTMTGNLILVRSGYPSMSLRDTGAGSSGRFQHSNHATMLESRDTDTDDNRRYLAIYDQTKQSDVKSALKFAEVVDGSYHFYDVIHDANLDGKNIGKKPINIVVTIPVSGWTASGSSYVQTVDCAGLLTTDGKNAVISAVGSSDADAQELTDVAFGMVDRWTCDTDGKLTARCPGAAPTVSFSVNVNIAR